MSCCTDLLQEVNKFEEEQKKAKDDDKIDVGQKLKLERDLASAKWVSQRMKDANI